jgi:DNA-binding winged helix-turn-helix (wHTH) protein/tetratricopeptide (TPR) repeat protein
MGHSLSNKLRFADCELDLATRELRRGGELVATEPRVFDLLAYLVAHRDRAVDKDEIQNAVWKGTIVSETALTRAIMKARRAVGDSADTQSAIRTVHGHGYQFVAALAEDAAEPVESVAAVRPPAVASRTRALVVVAAVVIAALVAWLWPAPAPGGPVQLAVMPVENATGDSEYDWTRLGLMGFANDIAREGAALGVVPASEVIRFAELGEGDDPVADFGRLRDIHGASHMLVSRLEKNASVLRLTYALYLPDGEIERGTMVGDEPTELMRGMIRSVGMTLGYRGGMVDEITVISPDPFINEAYSRGLSLSLEGRCADALKLFEVVMAGGQSDGRAEYEWANCASILGRWQEAEAGFEALLDELPTEPASSLRAMAYNGLGTVYTRTGRRDLARDTLKLGLDVARQAGDHRLQGMLQVSLAIDAKNRREFDEARELLARASLAHSEAGAGVLPGTIPAALANIDMAEGKLEQAAGHLDQALAAFRAVGDRRNEAKILNNYGYLRRLQGRMDDAEPLHLQSLEIRREIGDHVGQGLVLGMLSTVYAEHGRLEDARDAAAEAYRVAAEANDKLFMATGLAQLAAAQRLLGETDAARESFVESREIFASIGDFSRFAQATLRLAMLEQEAGNIASAEQTAAEVLEVTLREGLHEPAIEAMELQGDLARGQDDTDGSIAAYRRALAHIDETGFVSRQSRIVRKLAGVYLDEGDLGAVEPLLGSLVNEADNAYNLQLRARYAYLKGNTAQALSLLEATKAAAGDAWTDDDEALLAEYRAAAR